MRGLKIINGIVINVAVFKDIPNGWIPAPEGVGVGFIDNGAGSFSAPIIVTPQSEIDAKNRAVAALEVQLLRDDAINELLDWAETDSAIPANVKAKITKFKDKKPK